MNTDNSEAMRLADLFELEPDADSLYRQAAALLRKQSERIAELEAERDEHQATATALISLLADIRKACGDNGKRMQPELVEFIGSITADRDQLRAEVERLTKTDAEILAMSAGREQGLREAKEVCEQNAKRWPDLRGFYVANECAAAIEQLRA